MLEAAGPIFQLFGPENHLRSHVNDDPGDHNFGLDNRQAFYRMLGDHFFAGDAAFDAQEIPCGGEVKSNSLLYVSLPTNNATFNSLARALSQNLPRQSKLPTNRTAAEKWQRTHRRKLREIVRAPHAQAVAQPVGTEEKAGTQATFWRFRMDDTWTVPAVELRRGAPRGTVLLVADGGRQSVAAEAELLLAAGKRVLAVDPFDSASPKSAATILCSPCWWQP